MTSGEVVGSIFFSSDKLFRVEELSVSTSSNFINNSGFKINEHTSGDILTSTRFTEESLESIISAFRLFVRWLDSVGTDSVFKTEQFPTGITNLDTGLTNMDRNNFSPL